MFEYKIRLLNTGVMCLAFCLVLVVSPKNMPAADSPAAKLKKIPDEQLQFFERDVRPLLAKNCFRCHGEKKQEGELRLDLRSHVLRGGESGEVIVPGKPDESLLIESVRYESLEMPPDKKMSQQEVDVLTRWIELGAPWPDEKEPLGKVDSKKHHDVIWENAKTHWAFQPIEMPDVPADEHQGWAQNSIDRFVWQQQKKAGMTPSPRADRRTLLRRAYFDLIGMPASPREAAEFISDNSPDAYSRLIDRLLDDPRYGERWGRHWLDVARYADSKGAIFGEPRQYPYAYTYRDYVINSFNEDKPYNQFVREQLAADLLTDRKDDPTLAALGFLTVHRRLSQSRIEEQWIDRVDTVTRGLLGLTVACAQCHDHKYDPIPTADFYSLYGVFASIEEPEELPVIGRPEPGSELDLAYRKLVRQEDEIIQKYRQEQFTKVMEKIRNQIGGYLLVVHEGRSLSEGKMQSLAGKRKLNPYIATRWKKYLKENPKDAVFGAWHALAAIPQDQWISKSAETINQIAVNKLPDCDLNPLVSAAFQLTKPGDLNEAAKLYQNIFSETDKQWRELLEENNNDPSTRFVDKNREEIRQLMYGPEAPGVIPPEDFKMLDRPTYLALLKMNENRLIKLAVHPGAPKRAMVVRDKKELFDPCIYIRGDIERRGKNVPRQFLEILAGKNRQPFQKGAGRLELANAIVAPENPLTSRVIVNRVWHYHFGKGLLSTPSDFGLQSSQPVHHELLDYLAKSFMEDGWSIKYLHRLIMNSATYQQSSNANAEKQQLDPENNLLWKYNRRRLEYEAIHDSILSVTGKLDDSHGGPAVEMIRVNAFSYTKQSNWNYNPYRRAVYGVIARESLPTLLFTFDFADPATSNAARNSTTVPTQSLYMMNNKFIMEMAAALIARRDIQQVTDPRERIRQLFRLVYNREPGKNELIASVQFIEQKSVDVLPESTRSTWQYGYAIYNARQRTHDLRKLYKFPYFSGSYFQGSNQLPDKTNGLGWLRLTPTGGHAGSNRYCTVYRWTSPAAGLVSVSGILKHSPEQGDGIRATLYGPDGKIGQWEAHQNQTETNVKEFKIDQAGQLDFVVDFNLQNGWDGYRWTPAVLLKPTSNNAAKKPLRFSPAESFPKQKRDSKSPSQYGVWERYAQVLLISNEFLFIE